MDNPCSQYDTVVTFNHQLTSDELQALIEYIEASYHGNAIGKDDLIIIDKLNRMKSSMEFHA